MKCLNSSSKVSGTSNLNSIINACEYAALVFKLSLVELGFFITSLQHFLNFANSFLSCFLPSDLIYSVNFWHYQKQQLRFANHCIFSSLPTQKLNIFTQSKSTVKKPKAIKRWEAKTQKALFQSRN